MRRKIEIFTAGCPICDPIVALVKETACESSEIIIYNLAELYKDKTATSKIEQYGIQRLPAIAVDGKLIRCCKNIEITKVDLVNAGIGS